MTLSRFASAGPGVLKGRLAQASWTVDHAREMFGRALRAARNLVIDPPPRSDELIYEGYSLSYPEIHIRYRLRNAQYTHRVVLLDCSAEQFRSLEAAEWTPLLHHIGLSFAPFHQRVTDIAAVRATCMPLPDDLRRLYEASSLNGSAEFRYRSGLDPTRRIAYRSDVATEAPPPLRPRLEDKVLVLNGGGKDSIVAAELVRALGIPFAWFTVDTTAVQTAVIAASGSKHACSV